MMSIKARRLLHYFRRFVPALSMVPEPGSPFDPDEFVELLVRQWHGCTTPAEDDYIRLELSRDAFACELAEDVRNTFVKEKEEVSVSVFPISAFLMKAAAWLPIPLAIIGGIYALSLQLDAGTSYPVPAPEKEVVYQIRNATLGDIERIIEKGYGIKVIFDNKNVSRYRFSGYLDTKKPIEVFLGDLQVSHNIVYTFDEKNKVLRLK